MAKKINEWFQHEGLDRASMLLCALENAFGHPGRKCHPSIHNAKCRKQLSKATKALASLYQAIGEWEENE